MKKVVVGFVSAVALATIGMAAASDSMAASTQSSSNAAGVFVSGNLGYGKQDLKNSGLPSKDLRGFAWNASLGYQFNQYVAVEGGYTQFHTIKVNTTPNSTDNTLYGVGLLAKGIYPINDQFDVFAKAGAMDMFNKVAVGATTVRKSRIVPAFGIGTSYNVTSNVALTLQGITTLQSKSHAYTMPATYAAYAGVSYKFNV